MQIVTASFAGAVMVKRNNDILPFESTV